MSWRPLIVLALLPALQAWGADAVCPAKYPDGRDIRGDGKVLKYPNGRDFRDSDGRLLYPNGQNLRELDFSLRNPSYDTLRTADGELQEHSTLAPVEAPLGVSMKTDFGNFKVRAFAKSETYLIPTADHKELELHFKGAKLIACFLIKRLD